jgi:hypothetical protein
MKTMNSISRTALCGNVLLLVTALASMPLKGADLPSDLQLIAPEQVPASTCNWYSLSHWPLWPPCPANIFGSNADLYCSPSWGIRFIFVDDTDQPDQSLNSGFSASEESGEGGGDDSSWETMRNYQEFAAQAFLLIDTNNAAANDTNLYNACASFPADTNALANLQIKSYGANAAIIKANHFDYSAEGRDFALLVCDWPDKPTWKSIDLLGSSDAQDGWLVQGSVPSWEVTDPMYIMVSNIMSSHAAFFRAIPYGGPQMELTGPQPYDTVSNTISIQATIFDLSGVTNDQFVLTVDGAAARYGVGQTNTISINTKYNPNGSANLNLSGLSNARVYDRTNPPDKSRLVFESALSLPLDFENATYLAFASDMCSPDVGTNYFLYVIDRAQQVTATIYNPTNGQTLSTYSNYFPDAATVAVPWNFTLADGVTPYTNQAYAVSMAAGATPPLVITNVISRFGVRTAAGCFLTYQWEDPATLDGSDQDDKMDIWIGQTLTSLYENLYKPTSLTQYTDADVGTNRNHVLCKPRDSWSFGWDFILSQGLTNLDFSDFTLASAHGSGSAIGGGQDDFLPGTFDPNDLRRRVQGYPDHHNWRLRKSALWTCYNGSRALSTAGNAYDSWPDACGIPFGVDQTKALMRKNCGFFIGGKIMQRGFANNATITTARVAGFLDQTWICGKYQYPGGCDSFDFAINATRGVYNPQLDLAEPIRFGCPFMIYTGVYEDDLMNNNWTHIKTQ